jgi:hypothetical protein
MYDVTSENRITDAVSVLKLSEATLLLNLLLAKLTTNSMD